MSDSLVRGTSGRCLLWEKHMLISGGAVRCCSVLLSAVLSCVVLCSADLVLLGAVWCCSVPRERERETERAKKKRER